MRKNETSIATKKCSIQLIKKTLLGIPRCGRLSNNNLIPYLFPVVLHHHCITESLKAQIIIMPTTKGVTEVTRDRYEVVPSPLPAPAVHTKQQHVEINSSCVYGPGWEESHFKHSLPFSVTAGNIMRPLAEQYLNQYHFMNLNYCTRSDFATSHFQP